MELGKKRRTSGKTLGTPFAMCPKAVSSVADKGFFL